MTSVRVSTHDEVELAKDIETALQTIRSRSGMPVAFFGMADNEGSLRLTHFSGTTTSSLHGLKVSLGLGLGGRAATVGRPVSVSDYQTHRGITHDYDVPVLSEGLRSMTAVPIVVQGVFKGVIYGAIRQPLALGDRTISSVVAAGRQIEQNAVLRMARRSSRQELQSSTMAATREELREIRVELGEIVRLSDDPVVESRLSEVRERIWRALADPEEEESMPTQLSPREYDVLCQVSRGLTNRAVADTLGLESETVKSYLRNAMRKLGCHSRLQAINEARRRGWLD